MIEPQRSRHRKQDRTLFAVLVLVVAVTGVLAYQAWDAARSHRRVTEATLRDYATFASWELGRRLESSANAVLSGAFAPVLFRFADPTTDLPSDLNALILGVEDALHACGCRHAVSDYFLIDPVTLELQIHDARLGTEFETWLMGGFLAAANPAIVSDAPRMGIRARIAEEVPVEGNRRMIVMGTPPSNPVLAAPPPPPLDSARVVVYRGVHAGDRTRIFGFAVDLPELLRPLVGTAIAGPPLLPPSLAGPFRNEEMLSTTVWLAGRDTVFRTGATVPGGVEVVDTFRIATGSLLARTAVRPEMAARLVIGGLPRSRVPILLGCVGLALGLLLIALMQLRRQEELYRLRGDFVSGVSHELRTPLAQIRLFSDLLASGRLGEEQRRRSFRILTDEAKRLTYLVDNVLRFSRSERRTERIIPRPTDVGGFLREVTDDFAPLAGARDTRIELRCPPGLHGLIDTDALRQVMLNLLDNAVKYGPRGQTIHVTAWPQDGTLRIEVDDEGPGVPAADRERIWEPYRRLAREVEAATGGSGIGLAVVRELVGLHGGRAFVADGARGGARLIVMLPLASAGGEPADAAAANPPSRGAYAGDVAHG